MVSRHLIQPSFRARSGRRIRTRQCDAGTSHLRRRPSSASGLSRQLGLASHGQPFAARGTLVVDFSRRTNTLFRGAERSMASGHQRANLRRASLDRSKFGDEARKQGTNIVLLLSCVELADAVWGDNCSLGVNRVPPLSRPVTGRHRFTVNFTIRSPDRQRVLPGSARLAQARSQRDRWRFWSKHEGGPNWTPLRSGPTFHARRWYLQYYMYM